MKPIIIFIRSTVVLFSVLFSVIVDNLVVHLFIFLCFQNSPSLEPLNSYLTLSLSLSPPPPPQSHTAV